MTDIIFETDLGYLSYLEGILIGNLSGLFGVLRKNLILGKSGKRKEKLLLSERKDLSDIHVLFITFVIEHHAFDFCRGCSCEQEDWLPYTKVTDVWEGLLFVSIHSIARYQRRGVYLPILS